jgi:hypothetical protein
MRIGCQEHFIQSTEVSENHGCDLPSQRIGLTPLLELISLSEDADDSPLKF